MKTTSFLRRIGTMTAVTCMTLTATGVNAQDEGEDLAAYCARTAPEYCFMTLGYTSVECEEQYIRNCMAGGGGFSASNGLWARIEPSARLETGAQSEQV